MAKQLPDDWEILPLRNVVRKDRPISYGIVQTGAFIENGIPCVRVVDLTSGNLKPENMIRTSETISKSYKRTILNKDEIMFALRGDIGTVQLVPKELVRANLTRGIALISPRKGIDARFLLWALQSWLVRKDIYRCLNGSTFKEIPLGELRKIKIPFPPLLEQRKIADILSTWDETIAKTNGLIAALQRRKKGLMQRLLKGEVRFAGFDGKWKEVQLRDAFQRVSRKLGDKKVENFLSITATVGFVDQREKFGRVIAGNNKANYVLLKKGEFSYNKGNSNAYPQGCIYLLEEFEEGAVPNVYFSFSVKSTNQVHPYFYKHYFGSGSLNQQLAKYISSSARSDGLFNIAFDDFFKVKIPLPRIEEQKRIADVLNACDSEIRLQIKKLDALKEQKKGLMQRLLTGQVRVKV